jgi:hypothetical protein
VDLTAVRLEPLIWGGLKKMRTLSRDATAAYAPGCTREYSWNEAPGEAAVTELVLASLMRFSD